MRVAPRTPSSSPDTVTRLRRLLDRLRHPALLGIVLLAVGAAPAAYLSSGVRRSALVAPGDTVAVYGPRQFNGSGGNGTTSVERFTVALAPGKQYLLRLDNGTPGGANRATSAVTTLNGFQVVGTSDLNASTASVTKVVAVRQVDTLRITVVGAGSFVTATVSAAKTAEYAVNGPADYGVPSGTSKTYTFSFSKPASAGPPYRLYFTNGDSAGARRVTNASIVLNGATVVTTSEFTKSVGSLTKTVTLTATNNVTVDLKGSALTFTTLTFTATDTTAPVLTIGAPAAGAVTNASPITVSGTISDQSPTGVTVNGVAATVTNNTSYSASVPLTTQGNNPLTVVATDAGGRSTQLTRTVVYDTQTPSLSVSAPVDGLVTQAASVTVNATATDATALTVNTNGTPLTPGGGNSYSGSVALSAGANVLTTTATDAAGNATSVVRNVTRDNTAPALTVTAPADGTTTSADSVTVSGTVSDATAVTVAANGTALPVTSGSFSGKVGLVPGPNTISVVATDAAANSTTVTRTVTKNLVIPPDPSTLATPIDPTIATTLASATAFLYSGTDPIQTGVAPGAIVAQRASVIRGKVIDRTGAALSGVRVTILGHPELGQTVSRADGGYDMAVNGGGTLTVQFAKSGFLEVQRDVVPVWQAYAAVDSVAMTPLDPQITTIDFSTAAQTARGSVVSDASGSRQATMIFDQGTQAALVLPNGSTQPAGTLHIRATEFTVGALGPAAMPGALPRSSAYTYALELSADEAISAGASTVTFTNPVAFYVENFLNIPVGRRVPVAYYDRAAGKWKAEPDGRVVKILAVTGAKADLDVTGSGSAANQATLDSLGINLAEQQKLATLYTVGQTLWRTEQTHFTIRDLNYGLRLIDKAFPPLADILVGQLEPQPACKSGGSIITCEGQRLGEEIPIAGTPFSLHYESDRVLGHRVDRRVTIARQTRVDSSLITPSRPMRRNEYVSTVLHINYVLEVAGRRIKVMPALDPVIPATTIEWDGKDAYGRVVNGRQYATVRIEFEFPSQYGTIALSDIGLGPASFGEPGNVTVAGIAARQTFLVSQIWEGELGAWDARGQGLGGWTLTEQHVYDPVGGVLSRGDGSRVSARASGNVITTVLGVRGFSGYNGEGLAATATYINGVRRVAVGPDGSMYYADLGNRRVRRVSPAGIVATIAGDGNSGSGGDGGPATSAQLVGPRAVALGPDGSVYVADANANRVRRIAANGIISTVAGTGVAGYSGDGGPATSATISFPVDVAVAADGALFIDEDANHVIRRVGVDGIISTYAGVGAAGYDGDNGPARQAHLYHPAGIALAPDGTLYIADQTNNRIRKVGSDGIIRHVAGRAFNGYAGDGGPASAANVELYLPEGLAVGQDGSLYIADGGNRRIRRIGPDGMINTVAGTGQIACDQINCPRHGDGGLATQGALYLAAAVAVGPDGSLYISEGSLVRKVGVALPGLSPADMTIASRDGGELYQFESSGRHRLTRDIVTGDTLLAFAYNGSGYLTSATDADGNVTTVERNGQGQPTAVVGPFGQRTTVTLDTAGYLASVANPKGEIVRLYTSPLGLLDSLADPRGKLHRFTYEPLGRLRQDSDPAGGSKSLTLTEADTTYTVDLSTGLGRTTSYRVDRLPSGAARRVVTAPDGFATTQVLGTDGSTSVTGPDGTLSTLVEQADPRFGVQAPMLKSLSVRLPSALTSNVTATSKATLANAADPLSLTSALDSLQVNGNVFTTAYDAATQRTTTTTPEGRQAIARTDSVGRVRSERTVGLDSVSYQYDVRGRLSQVRSGGRTWTYGYDGLGRLLSTLDPLGRRDSLFYDTADRLTRRVLPGGREVRFAYDSSGNLTGVTPPSRPAHGFGYNAVDQATSYAPPNVGLTTPGTSYSYNVDRQLTQITRPDSVTIGFGYEATTGRLGTISFDRGQVTLGYSAATGQLTGLTAPGGATLGFTYDGMLPKTVTWGGPVTGSVGVGYNTDFRVTSQTVNGANSLTFGYDRDGLLTTAGALGIKRHAQHGLVERDSLDTVKGAWSYTSRGALAGYAATSGATTLFQTAYTRDSLDRITSLTETIGGGSTTSAFTYDSAGRLFEVRRDGVLTATYEYDANGNRTRLTTPGGVVTGSYDDQDRLTSYGTTTYTYGSNGELKTKVEPGVGSTSYTYDALGNLVAATLPDGTALSYVIDGQNRRIGKKVNGVLVQGFLYQSQLAPVAELDGGNQVVSRFVYGSRANVPDYMVKGGVTYRIISDHLGSVRLVVNAATGTIAQRIDYDEYGRITQNTAPGFQPFGYAGGLLENHTGLTRFGARDYDPTTGRWTAKDPVGFVGGSSNLYLYSFGDPLQLVDPTGRAPVNCDRLRRLVDQAAHELVDDIGRFDPTSPEAPGHAKEIRQRKSGLKDLIERYRKNCYGRKGGDPDFDSRLDNEIAPLLGFDPAYRARIEGRFGEFLDAYADVLEAIGRGLAGLPQPPLVPFPGVSAAPQIY